MLKNMASEELSYTGAGGERIDAFIAHALPRFSRTKVQALIKQGSVLLNERPARASDKLEPGDTIRVHEPAQEPAEKLQPAPAFPLDILFEDDTLMVINKPAGIVVHPAAGHDGD